MAGSTLPPAAEARIHRNLDVSRFEDETEWADSHDLGIDDKTSEEGGGVLADGDVVDESILEGSTTEGEEIRLVVDSRAEEGAGE